MTDEQQGIDLERLLRRQVRRPGAFERFVDGSECPSEHELAALAENVLAEPRVHALHEHLARCGHCLLLVQGAMEEIALAEEESAPRAAPRLRLLPGKPAWMTMAAAAAVLLAFWALWAATDDGTRFDTSRVARLEPLPTTTPRGPADDDAELAYRRAIELYTLEDWLGAETALRECLALDPERGDALLYLASCLLLTGRAAEAVSPLEQALEGFSGARLEEAQWQLAQARLVTGRLEPARELLEALAAGAGRRARDARAVLEQLPPR